MKLEDCTKDELIHFIKEQCFYREDSLEFKVLSYRSDVAFKKYQEESKLSMEALEEHIALLKEYDGKKILDIPINTLKKANEASKLCDEHRKKADNYYKKYKNIGKQINKALDVNN